MSMPAKPLKMTVEEYLNAEEFATVRHEFVDGQTYAMTGATEAHNCICSNLHALIHGHLRKSNCRVYINDMKVWIESTNSFYYPDILITCEPYDGKSVFKSMPTIILEILSPSTTRIDLGEKLNAYKQVPGLREYGVVYQDQRRLELHRKTTENLWQTINYKPPEQVLLSSLLEPFQMSFDDIYERTDIR